ncbi:MAG: DUF3108 domain-containing protein [Prolixibacteraceae bacterium]|nr:DUF3108 domain-containing protein [Prolixibacteraceae bacterium]
MRWFVFHVFLLSGLSIFAQPRYEKLLFDLHFGFVKGGEAVFLIKDTVVGNNGEIHAVLHGYTTGLADWFYSVNDRFESIICEENDLPKKSLKQLKEQKYRFYNEVTFDHEAEKAYSKVSGWHDVESGICDLSSLLYHLRFSGKLEGLLLGQIIEIPFWDTDEWYTLELKYTGLDKVQTPMGHVECIRLEPQHVSGRFFNRRNPMNVWITNDHQKVPVLMELNFSIGTVRCILREVPSS